MTLAPKLPPGRANRKALQFVVDIHRLRDAGYTFSAIQVALLDAGINVSLTTIKREASQSETSHMPSQPLGVAQRPLTPPVVMAACPDATKPRPSALPGASGREVAEAFFATHPSNPLFPIKETS